ncbi:cupin domain-containing protein [Synechococcus sp. CBW1107]|uniref:1,2-dihydroxy-3-keto-5-methylthiopentene dioxygenase n=1 Tax=Synechococcus sp. CBW1107 TaxID=2789857 RepID=UPI002AD32B88|nr:cupin domain-containing protein [Synechococcus sp. CBW1107]
MSRLQIHPLHPPTPGHDAQAMPLLSSEDGAVIAAELAARGLRFERWPARGELVEGADQEAILSAYASEISRIQSQGRYPTVDAIRLGPDHPDRQALRQKFLAEHTHAEDEVRFFVEGRGLFCLHIGEEVLQVLCTRGDLIGVPAGTRHWFDMGATPRFTALRFFDNPEGWVARFTGDDIASRYPLLDP